MINWLIDHWSATQHEEYILDINKQKCLKNQCWVCMHKPAWRNIFNKERAISLSSVRYLQWTLNEKLTAICN